MNAANNSHASARNAAHNAAGDDAVDTATIVAPTSREALRMVREQLGADAVIVANRATAHGIEIVAIAACAADTPAAASANPGMAPANSAPVLIGGNDGSANTSVLTELQAMRGMIEDQLAGLVWNEKQRRDPVRGHLLRTLLGAGFSAGLAKAMLDRLPGGQDYASGMLWVKAELARNLPVQEDEDALLDAGGVYALMGPTGIGKTTTTAKLAARCVLRFGPGKLALLTTDTYRIGAYEQLRIYGQILGVSVHAVKDAADLRRVLDAVRDKHMVLIDTVGKSQRDRSVAEQVAMLCGAARPVKRLLLLNAASHGDTLNEVVHAYRCDSSGNQLAGCIFTKMDEATHPGALLDTAIRHRLPVHYVSSGQQVPENLMIANRSELIDSVFQAHSRTALFVPGEADLDQPPAALPQVVAAQEASHATTTRRLRTQCQQLIRALPQDAEELRCHAAALAAADIGFGTTRRLWRALADDAVRAKAVTQTLMAQARQEIAAGCSEYVLAVGARIGLPAASGGDDYTLHGGLLLSDRSGMALAAPQQLLTTATVRPRTRAADNKLAGSPVLRQLAWLQQQDFGKPVVHVLERMPSIGGLQWLARGRATTVVLSGATATTLAQLTDRLTFSAPQAILYKGHAALQSLAEVTVGMRNTRRSGSGGTPELSNLRCVATRIVDQRTGKTLAQWQLLSNLAPSVTAAHIVEWYRWHAAARAYFKLLKQAVNQLGGCGAPGDPDTLKRVLIAAQAGTTVWRLQHAQAHWSGPARVLLAQLAGRTVRSKDGASRALPGAVLFEGMAKLLDLLEILDPDSGLPPAAPIPVADRLMNVAMQAAMPLPQLEPCMSKAASDQADGLRRTATDGARRQGATDRIAGDSDRCRD